MKRKNNVFNIPHSYTTKYIKIKKSFSLLVHLNPLHKDSEEKKSQPYIRNKGVNL